MIKLKNLLKESTWVNRKFGEPLPTMKDYQEAHNKKKMSEKVEITPDKEGPINTKMGIDDNPFDEGKLSEADYLNITIPSQVKRWMKKFIVALNSAKLNRIKTISILYQVIEGLGLDIREIQMYIPKIKAQIRKQKRRGDDEAEEGKY